MGRERRGPQARPAADRAPPRRAGRGCGSSRSSRCWKTSGAIDLDRHRLGDRRRRERPRGPADATPTGSARSATSAERRACRSSSSSGAACRRARPAASSTAGPTTSSRAWGRGDAGAEGEAGDGGNLAPGAQATILLATRADSGRLLRLVPIPSTRSRLGVTVAHRMGLPNAILLTEISQGCHGHRFGWPCAHMRNGVQIGPDSCPRHPADRSC